MAHSRPLKVHDFRPEGATLGRWVFATCCGDVLFFHRSHHTLGGPRRMYPCCLRATVASNEQIASPVDACQQHRCPVTLLTESFGFAKVFLSDQLSALFTLKRLLLYLKKKKTALKIAICLELLWKTALKIATYSDLLWKNALKNCNLLGTTLRNCFEKLQFASNYFKKIAMFFQSRDLSFFLE